MMSKTVWLSALSCIVLTSQVYSFPSKSMPDSSRSSSTESFDEKEFGEKLNVLRDYQFAYEVRDAKTTNFQNRIEVSKDGLLQGSYSHLAPDGVVRTVVYSDDGTTGYQVTMKEEPTNITVIGSGLPGDPLREGKSTSATNEDFHALINLINSNGKFGEGTKFGFPASSIEFPVFGNSLNSKSASSSEDSDRSRNENQSLESTSLGSTSAEITSGSADEELDNSLGFGSKTRVKNSKNDDSKSFGKVDIDSMTNDDGESAIFVSKDAINTKENFKTSYKQDTSEEISDQSHGSEGGIPVVVLDQSFLKSLNSQGAMSTQKLVEAIQQAMQAALFSNMEEHKTHKHPDLKNIDNKVLTISPEELAKTPIVEPNSNNNYDSARLTPQAGVPVIVIDKKVFDSLGDPRSKMTRQQFAMGIQQALFSALESAAPNKHPSAEATVSGLSKKMESTTNVPQLESRPNAISKEVNTVDSESSSLKGGLPVIALDKKVFDSLDSPGSSMSKQQLVQFIQEALQKAVGMNDISSSEKYNNVADEKEVEYQAPHNDATSTSPNSEAKVTPVVAIQQKIFESLDAPGSSMTKQQLVEAIQNALNSAMEIAEPNNKATSEPFENEIPKEQLLVSSGTKGEASGTEKVIYSPLNIDNDIGNAAGAKTLEGFTPVIALEQSLFDSLSAKGKGPKKNLVEAIQQALNSAIDSTVSAAHDKFSDSEEEEDESLGKSLSSSAATALESNVIMTGASGKPFTVVQDSNQNDDNDQDDNSEIISLNQEFFKSLEDPQSTMNGGQLLQAMQQALNSAKKSSSPEKDRESSSDSSESINHKHEHELLNLGTSVKSTLHTSNSKSGVTDDRTPSNSGSGFPVVALRQEVFDSLDSPGSTVNRQQFVQAIQHALQSAIKSSPSTPEKANHSEQTNEKIGKSISSSAASNTVQSNGKIATVGAPSFTIVQENEQNEEDDHNANSIPIITLDQAFYKSLESQGRSGNNHPIVLAMQQALKSALKGSFSKSANQVSSDSLIAAESDEEHNGFLFETPNANLGDAPATGVATSIPGGGIPVLGLDRAQFDSLDAPGSPMTKQQLIQAIQQAMDAALKSTATPKILSKNDLANKSSIQKTNETSGGKVGQRFIFPNEQDVPIQDESGEKQTTIVFENTSGLGFKSFANSMKDFLEMHNQVMKPIEKSAHT